MAPEGCCLAQKRGHLGNWRSCTCRLKADENVEAFCERCVADAGVLLAPDSMFDLDGTAGSNSFRVGFGRANLPKCIQHLETYLASTTKES